MHLSIAGTVGREAAGFFSDSFAEGVKFEKLKLGIESVAGSKDLGAEWIKDLRKLSTESGLSMDALGGRAPPIGRHNRP